MIIDLKLCEEMLSRNEKSYRALNFMFEFLDKTLDDKEVSNDPLSTLATSLLARFQKTLSALRILCVSGLEEDTRALLRILLEELFTLCYIKREPEKRLKLYVNYQIIIRKKTIEIYEKHYPDLYNKLTHQEIEKILREYNEIKDDYRNKNSWCDKSMRVIADELGDLAPFWYDIVYSTESAHIHSSIMSSGKLLFEDENFINVKVGPYPFCATDPLSKAAEMTRMMLIECYEIWEKNPEEILAVWNKAKELITQEFLENNTEGE